MRVLFVLGSPRRNGNTETLARMVAESVSNFGHTVEFLRLGRKKVLPCQGCGGCEKSGDCVITHDDMGSIYQQVDSADRLVIVSPVYFYGVTAQTKAVIDRFQSHWSRKYLLKKEENQNTQQQGFYIGCAATSGNKVFDGCLLTIKCFFDALDMKYGGEFLIRHVDGIGDIKKVPDIHEESLAFGKRIVA